MPFTHISYFVISDRTVQFDSLRSLLVMLLWPISLQVWVILQNYPKLSLNIQLFIKSIHR